MLLLLIVAVALHFALSASAAVLRARGRRGPSRSATRSIECGGILVAAQTLLICGAAVVFSGLLYRLLRATRSPARRCAPPRSTASGARLVGIRPREAGTIAYLLASLLAGLSGVLIAPVTTIFYDSGFLIGLKAFVAAIIGAMVSYPLTALGAVLVGLLESFASFWSSAFKEVIVFSVCSSRCCCGARLAHRRNRRGSRGMSAPHIRILAAAVVILLAAAPLYVQPVQHHAAQLYRRLCARRARARAAHRRRRHGVVRAGRLRRHRRLRDRVAHHAQGCSPWLGLVLALVLTGAAAAAIGAVTLRLGGHFLALSTVAWGLSISFLFGNIDGARTFHRHLRHSADLDRAGRRSSAAGRSST